ncbi:MAG: PAS domain S-box protein [Candidatus Marinimicrobia bacterium]|nr:PAS domain S-box protein [Candidatus Neomarinimicrobiota bacterium]
MKKSTAKNNQSEISKKEKSILQEELVASELRYRLLFEAAKDGILILNAKTGRIVDVNPFLIDLLGYSKNEFIEKSIWEIGAFQDIIENKDKFLELQQSEYVRYEDLPLERSDGSKIYVEFVSNVYLVNDNKVIQCQIRDITARKETEAVLEKTANELAEIKKTADELNKFTENIIDTIREPLLAIDKDLRVIKASRSFYNFFKVTAGETIGKTIYELGNHQWDIPKLRELLEKIIPEKRTFDNYEVEHDFSTIGRRVMLLNARQVKRAFGKEQIILLAIEDITERKGKEDILKETHRATSDFLNILLNHMHAPIIIWDASFVIKRFNSKFEKLSGYGSAEVIGKKIDFLLPKEKIAATRELLKNHLDDKHLEEVEIEILTKDNNIKTVLWNSARIFDEEGKNIIATISQDITSHKRIQNEMKFQADLINNVGQAVIATDLQGKVTYWNKAAEKIYGWSSSEAIGQNIMDLMLAQQTMEQGIDIMQKLSEGKTWAGEFLVKRKDGSSFPALVTDAPMFDSDGKLTGIIGISSDITERKQVENELSQSEEKFRLLFNEVEDAIFRYDHETYEIIEANEATSKIYGYNQEELIGMSALKFSAEVEKSKSASKTALRKGKTIVNFRHHKKKDGTDLFLKMQLHKIVLNNQPITYAVCHDITENIKYEQDLKAAKEKAEESDRLKSAFLANMSHEIRTPMNGILGFTNLLLNPDLNSEKKESYINIVHQSGKRLLHTVNDIIEISKIEAGMIHMIEKLTDINQRLEELTRFFRFEAQKKGLKLSLEKLLPPEKKYILTDQNKFDSILTNLIENAIKYTETGTITIGCRHKNSEVEFYIKDTGIGIPAHRHEAVFNRFEQADIADTGAIQGSGLGLAICKSYVEMLGGNIWLKSQEGKGSTFYFTLPVKNNLEERSNTEKEISFESKNPKSKVKALKILIVEDDKASATISFHFD